MSSSQTETKNESKGEQTPSFEIGEMPELTREQLAQLESKPKTKGQYILEYLIAALPILTGIAAILEYFLIPNYKGLESTLLYPSFIGVLVVAFGLALLFSLRSKILFATICYKAPFYSLIFALMLAYDWLTLKTNTLITPYFPSIDQVLNAFITDAGYLTVSVKSSLILLMTGYLWGVGLGLLTGIACGYNKHFSYWISPFLKLLGAIPSVTWIPITMILMKTLFQASVFVIALGVWFAVTIACITGIKNIDRAYFEAARTLGAKGSQLILRIAIPSAVPNIFQGMTQGMSTACMALLSAEMIGSDAGLGWYIQWQRSWAQYAKMYAAIVLLCIIFVVVNWLMNTIRGHILRWKEGEVEA